LLLVIVENIKEPVVLLVIIQSQEHGDKTHGRGSSHHLQIFCFREREGSRRGRGRRGRGMRMWMG
jgi:hypothetical protein